MPVPNISKEESSALLKSLLSVYKDEATSACVQLCGEKVLLLIHPRPSFLPPHPLNMVVIAQPYSEVAKTRAASVSSHDSLGVNTPKKRSTTSELDVTGSPLRNNFALDEVGGSLSSPYVVSLPPSERSTGPPITTLRTGAFSPQTAHCLWRVLRSCQRLASKQLQQKQLLPVLVVVDGTDTKGSALFGLHRSPGRTSHCTVCSTGPTPMHQLPQLDTLRALCTGPAAAKVETTAYATYDLLATSGGEDTLQGATEDSSCVISLNCCWPRPTALLSRPAPDARTELNIHVPAGQSRGLVSRELKVLASAVAGVSSRQLVWPVTPAGHTDTETRITKLLTQHQAAGREKASHGPETRGSYDLDDVLSGGLSAHNTDFLDQLWLVLADSESLHSLRSNLLTVFKAISAGHIRPRIHVRNSTRVGIMSRSLMRGQSPLPEMTGLQPMHMLIELGLCKVNRDLTAILQAGDLATEDQLAQLVSPTAAPADVELPEAEQVEVYEARLQQLHLLQLLLHVVTCCRQQLKLSHATLAVYTVQMLEQLRGHEGDVVGRSFTFNFQLQTSAVKDLLQRLAFTSWRVSITNTESVYSCQLDATVSRVPILRIVSPTDEFSTNLSTNDTAAPEPPRRHYYCTYVTTVTDSMFG